VIVVAVDADTDIGVGAHVVDVLVPSNAVDCVVVGAPSNVALAALAALAAPPAVGPSPALVVLLRNYFEKPHLLLWLLLLLLGFQHWQVVFGCHRLVSVVVVVACATPDRNTAHNNIDLSNRFLACWFSSNLCARRRIFPRCRPEATQP